MVELKVDNRKYFVEPCSCGGIPMVKKVGIDNKMFILECNQCGNKYAKEASYTVTNAVRLWNNKGKDKKFSSKKTLYRVLLSFGIITIIIVAEHIICYIGKLVINLFK